MNDVTGFHQSLFHLCADVRYRVIGGQAVIIVQDAGEAIVLNEVGTRVLELVEGEHGFATIVDELCEQFDVERQQAETDLDDYLRDLVEAGVVESTEPPTPNSAA